MIMMHHPVFNFALGTLPTEAAIGAEYVGTTGLQSAKTLIGVDCLKALDEQSGAYCFLANLGNIFNKNTWAHK